MNYQETTVTGESWTRSPLFVGQNGIGGVPSITFHEERAINLGSGDVITRPLGSITEPFTPENAGEIFNLVHPDTGVIIGTMTYQEMYVALHSLYMHRAAKRDAEMQA